MERREFLKKMGIGIAGVGAISLGLPVIKSKEANGESLKNLQRMREHNVMMSELAEKTANLDDPRMAHHLLPDGTSFTKEELAFFEKSLNDFSRQNMILQGVIEPDTAQEAQFLNQAYKG